MSLVSFYTPWKNIRKPVVFWCFQGVQKETSGMSCLDAATLISWTFWLPRCTFALLVFFVTSLSDFILVCISRLLFRNFFFRSSAIDLILFKLSVGGEESSSSSSADKLIIGCKLVIGWYFSVLIGCSSSNNDLLGWTVLSGGTAYVRKPSNSLLAIFDNSASTASSISCWITRAFSETSSFPNLLKSKQWMGVWYQFRYKLTNTRSKLISEPELHLEPCNKKAPSQTFDSILNTLLKKIRLIYKHVQGYL